LTLGLKKEMKRRTKGQALIEFSICLAIVLTVYFGMQFYVKRGLQGRYRDIVDEGTAPLVAYNYAPYEPYYARTSTAVRTDERVEETMEMGGAWKRSFPASEFDAATNHWSDSVAVNYESTENSNVEGSNLVWQY
jgi:hypothetical protein